MPRITQETDSPRTPAEDRFLAECFLAFDVTVGKVALDNNGPLVSGTLTLDVIAG